MVVSVLLMMLSGQLGVPMKLDERKALVKAMSKEDLAAFMTDTPQDELIDLGLRAIEQLGTYQYTMVKRERVKGELLPAQDIVTSVREKPFAVRLEYVGGPGKGRRVLYNPEVRKDDFRVREAGFLSIAGALWISLDSSLAKGDSNHTCREAGIGNLLRRFRSDLGRSKQFGGYTVKHEGWDARGHSCSLYTAPNGGKGFELAASRICTDLESAIPSKVEGFDASGAMVESYVFSDLSAKDLGDAFFTPNGAGL